MKLQRFMAALVGTFTIAALVTGCSDNKPVHEGGIDGLWVFESGDIAPSSMIGSRMGTFGYFNRIEAAGKIETDSDGIIRADIAHTAMDTTGAVYMTIDNNDQVEWSELGNSIFEALKADVIDLQSNDTLEEQDCVVEKIEMRDTNRLIVYRKTINSKFCGQFHDFEDNSDKIEIELYKITGKKDRLTLTQMDGESVLHFRRVNQQEIEQLAAKVKDLNSKGEDDSKEEANSTEIQQKPTVAE